MQAGNQGAGGVSEGHGVGGHARPTEDCPEAPPDGGDLEGVERGVDQRVAEGGDAGVIQQFALLLHRVARQTACQTQHDHQTCTHSMTVMLAHLVASPAQSCWMLITRHSNT